MASFISAESKSDYKVKYLTKEVCQSTEEGCVASKISDTLDQPDISGARASSLPGTRPWQQTPKATIRDVFKGLTKELQEQLKKGVWAAVLDPDNTTNDTAILEKKDIRRVDFTYLSETLETSDPDFGKKILKLDPCGELARKGLERWITNRDISSI